MKRFIRNLLEKYELMEFVRDYRRKYFPNKLDREELHARERRLGLYSKFVRKGDLVFDIGANVGNRSEIFLTLGAAVIALEPQPRCANFLRKKFRGKDFLVLQQGVSTQKGELEMLVSTEASTLSTFSRDWVNEAKRDRFKDYEWDKTIKVQVTTLDELIKQYGKPDFCKIDVEGYEYEVLSGLSEALPAISFEYAMPEGRPMIEKILFLMKSLDPNYLLNYSVGESMKLQMNEFISIEAFLKDILHSSDFEDSKFGDIYLISK